MTKLPVFTTNKPTYIHTEELSIETVGTIYIWNAHDGIDYHRKFKIDTSTDLNIQSSFGIFIK